MRTCAFSSSLNFGLAETIHLRCIYDIFGWDFTRCTVYTAHIYVYGSGNPYESPQTLRVDAHYSSRRGTAASAYMPVVVSIQ